MKNPNKQRAAFTMIELLVTLFIIAIIVSLSVIVYDVAWSKSRNSKRVSDIIRIQNALEKYHQQQGQYPDSLTFGENLTDQSGNVYMIDVPQNPKPRTDGDCADQEYTYSTSTNLYGNENFFLEFCIGDKSDQIEKGINCATSQGITAGACPSGNLNTGLKLWLRADGSVTSRATSSTILVDSWNDESGNGNNVTQSDSTKRPTFVTSTFNGKPAIRFDGINDFLTGGDVLDMNDDEWTIFVVGKSNGANGSFVAKSFYGGYVGRYGLLYYGGNLLYIIQDDDDVHNTQISQSSGSYKIFSTERAKDPNQNILYVNNAPVATTTISNWYSLNTPLRFLVGAYNNNPDTSETMFLDGDINEIMIYNRILSTSEKEAIKSYFEDKYEL